MFLVGAEIIALSPVQCDFGTYLHCHLADTNRILLESIGRTEFHAKATVPIENRIASTGILWSFEFEVNPLTGARMQCPECRSIHASGNHDLCLVIKTNISQILCVNRPSLNIKFYCNGRSSTVNLKSYEFTRIPSVWLHPEIMVAFPKMS